MEGQSGVVVEVSPSDDLLDDFLQEIEDEECNKQKEQEERDSKEE